MKDTFCFAAQCIVLSFFLACSSTAGPQPVADSPHVGTFIDEMVRKHGFTREELEHTFHSVKKQQSILNAISRPAEGKPWHAYRKIFLTGARIDGGVKFWRNNQETLTAVEGQTGVPAEIIVAIIGVETRYGGNTGSYRVIDALSTLAFYYPRRSAFFRSELEQFLLLCRDEGLSPTVPKGSYAGAMGLPQFMPSSFRHYAADFDGDQKRDIWNNRADVIASVANYFIRHGWRVWDSIAYPTRVNGTDFKQALTKELEPRFTFAQMARWGIHVPQNQPPETKAKLLQLEGAHGPEYWLGLHNFYVITRYNHSPLYAMAVYQLSHAIRTQHSATGRR